MPTRYMNFFFLPLLFSWGRWMVQKGQNSVYINIECPQIRDEVTFESGGDHKDYGPMVKYGGWSYFHYLYINPLSRPKRGVLGPLGPLGDYILTNGNVFTVAVSLKKRTEIRAQVHLKFK